MTRILLVWMLLLAGFAVQAQTDQAQTPEPREFEYQEGDTTYVMKRYVMVLLLRGDKAHDYSEEELKELQAGHMDNMNRLAEAGKLVIAGPFGDDGDLRGICIMDTETVAEAEELMSADPAIQAGRLRMECHPWWGAKGTVLK